VTMAVLEKELLPLPNIHFGKYPNAMLSVHSNSTRIAVGLVAVICKLDFGSFSCSINYECFVQIEEITSIKLIVQKSSSIRFLLRDHLSNILRYECVFFCIVPCESAPSMNSRPTKQDPATHFVAESYLDITTESPMLRLLRRRRKRRRNSRPCFPHHRRINAQASASWIMPPLPCCSISSCLRRCCGCDGV